jgi:hypothetical protein
VWVVDVAGDVGVVILGHDETAFAERRRNASSTAPTQAFLTKAYAVLKTLRFLPPA